MCDKGEHGHTCFGFLSTHAVNPPLKDGFLGKEDFEKKIVILYKSGFKDGVQYIGGLSPLLDPCPLQQTGYKQNLPCLAAASGTLPPNIRG